ncbi:unnamed protein product, partial [Agarophyton chilense]
MGAIAGDAQAVRRAYLFLVSTTTAGDAGNVVPMLCARRNLSGQPVGFERKYSAVSARSDALTVVELPATNVMLVGNYALVIRASANGTQCFGGAGQHARGTEVVFEAMPAPCPLVAEEPARQGNGSGGADGRQRIVGGTAVNDANSGASFGWMALIWEVRGTQTVPVCGGSQFRAGFIATAAHCEVQLAPQRFRVSVGRNAARAAGANLLRVATAQAHPRYTTLASNEALYDAAVVQLAGSGSSVGATIALNNDTSAPSEGEMVTAAGFGYVSEDWAAVPAGGRLLRVDVPTTSAARCAATFDG